MTIEADPIEQLIPHRYPMLLVDRVIEVEDGKSAVALGERAQVRNAHTERARDGSVPFTAATVTRRAVSGERRSSGGRIDELAAAARKGQQRERRNG